MVLTREEASKKILKRHVHRSGPSKPIREAIRLIEDGATVPTLEMPGDATQDWIEFCDDYKKESAKSSGPHPVDLVPQDRTAVKNLSVNTVRTGDLVRLQVQGVQKLRLVTRVQADAAYFDRQTGFANEILNATLEVVASTEENSAPDSIPLWRKSLGVASFIAALLLGLAAWVWKQKLDHFAGLGMAVGTGALVSLGTYMWRAMAELIARHFKTEVRKEAPLQLVVIGLGIISFVIVAYSRVGVSEKPPPSKMERTPIALTLDEAIDYMVGFEGWSPTDDIREKYVTWPGLVLNRCYTDERELHFRHPSFAVPSAAPKANDLLARPIDPKALAAEQKNAIFAKNLLIVAKFSETSKSFDAKLPKGKAAKVSGRFASCSPRDRKIVLEDCEIVR